jgi:hypothetical protein
MASKEPGAVHTSTPARSAQLAVLSHGEIDGTPGNVGGRAYREDMVWQNRAAGGQNRAVSQWHLWLGSGIKRRRCEVCGTRWFILRYTNGDLDVLVCLRHRGVISGRPPE